MGFLSTLRRALGYERASLGLTPSEYVELFSKTQSAIENCDKNARMLYQEHHKVVVSYIVSENKDAFLASVLENNLKLLHEAINKMMERQMRHTYNIISVPCPETDTDLD